MKVNCVIIDDELHNLENLNGLINRYCPNLCVLALASSAKEGLLLIDKYKPDLVFLDIEMPVQDGFSMLKSLQEINFEVIFVTAYNQYMLQAIKTCALDYLMKPVSILELKEAVLKVEKVVVEKRENERIKVLIDNLKNTNKFQRVALPTSEALNFVPINDIIRCKGENNYTLFYLVNGETVLVSKTLKEWEALLVDYQFIRTHKSHLINSTYAKAYVKKDGGYVLMEDGSAVSVSKSRKEETIIKLTELK
ncbi:hypothetical protein BFR04_01835 [Gaetbulibacter sp. 4G1]|nr:LytTR family DNA-binding domain-containing protein [Gaetbulibacter sp. 4G1]PIA79610.1 hypothetical protein BFR04_01835 [Gaetbulibacter sp. 4G1]